MVWERSVALVHRPVIKVALVPYWFCWQCTLQNSRLLDLTGCHVQGDDDHNSNGEYYSDSHQSAAMPSRSRWVHHCDSSRSLIQPISSSGFKSLPLCIHLDQESIYQLNSPFNVLGILKQVLAVDKRACQLGSSRASLLAHVLLGGLPLLYIPTPSVMCSHPFLTIFDNKVRQMDRLCCSVLKGTSGDFFRAASREVAVLFNFLICCRWSYIGQINNCRRLSTIVTCT